MTPAARFKALSEILSLVFDHEAAPADRVLSEYVRKRRYIGSKDRRFFYEQLFALLRNRGPLLYYKQKWPGLRSSMEQEVLLFSFLHLKLSLDDVAHMCDGKNYHFSPLTSEERSFLNSLSHGFETLPLWASWSYPFELESFLFPIKSTQDACSERLAPFLKEAPLDLRVNTLKMSREDVLRSFDLEGIAACETPYSSVGIRLLNRPSLTDHILFKKGAIEIQDESSQLGAFLVDPQPGERVLDFCAGAGGKSLVLGALMQNKGVIVATDIHSVRLQKAQERFRRAGIHLIETRLLEHDVSDKWIKRQKEKFDRIIVDVPCSGSGTWRRNPDQKWKITPSNLENLQKTQLDILNKVFPLLKKGGRLVYATCSLFPQENENIIDTFLNVHGDYFKKESAAACLKGPDILFENGFLKLSPHKTGTDGFFAAVLSKKA